MTKEAEYRNFENKPEYDFKFDWAVGRKFELRILVDSGKLRIRTEITSLPSEGGEENKSNENN